MTAAILLVVRPLSAWVSLAGYRASFVDKSVIAFFGIRGLGSFYYLAFALGQARPGPGLATSPSDGRNKTHPVRGPAPGAGADHGDGARPRSRVAYDVHDVVDGLVERSLSSIRCRCSRRAGRWAGLLDGRPSRRRHNPVAQGRRAVRRLRRRAVPVHLAVRRVQHAAGVLGGRSRLHGRHPGRAGGIIRHGAKMVTAVSEATVPKISVIVRKAYGAGLYAMSARRSSPRRPSPCRRPSIAVMGPEAAVNAVFANRSPPSRTRRSGPVRRRAACCTRRTSTSAPGVRAGDRRRDRVRGPARRDPAPARLASTRTGRSPNADTASRRSDDHDGSHPRGRARGRAAGGGAGAGRGRAG